ncbi:spore germination protein [Fodinisporobacter ferrooxydans]|uniref:Spore germination protein n=1 Tax=Fodinisporobacter ferrooxydans TaxID=2901836 RepID=A0ABY4CEA7_9BACL|nr:spore germination protein [Alicyclobacillaceae bacterium MYW30-H2]
MIIMFEIGSTPLFELGSKAKQDSWLAILVAMVAGILVLSMFLYIQSQEPDKNLVQILIHYFGKWLGRSFAVLYILYFAYESMRNVRDIGDIINITILPNTPISVIMFAMMFASTYAVFQGIEVFSRTTIIIIIFVIFSYILLILMFFSSGDVHFERLQPMLENGWIPVLEAAFPAILSFPFGQMVVFLMFWNYLSDKQVMVKLSFWSYLFVGVLLVFMNIMNIAVLGTNIADRDTLPLLNAVQLISVADFLERFDPFVTFLLFYGVFIKMTTFYFGAVLGSSQLFHMRHTKVILPIGAAIYAASFLEPNWAYHVWLGIEISVKYIFPFFQLVIPIGLFFVMVVKKGSVLKRLFRKVRSN